MLSTTVKKIYVAKCMSELETNTRVENALKSRSTSSLVASAQKVFHAAEMSFLEMDEEKAYVQYTRFVELVLLLKSKPDFKKNSESKKLSLNANTAIGKAEKLKESLLKRYSILQEADCRAENEKNDRLSSQNSQPEVILPVEAVASNAVTQNADDVIEYSISSSRLLNLLTTSMSNIILMDTRSSEDFDESHIKHSQCINIPEEILLPATTAARLESMLPKDSLGIWYQREKADHIVLIDWDSKDESTQNTHIEALKQAMSKWDQNCVLKKPPMILQGGYRDWMLKYPMYTTQVLHFSVLNDSRPPSNTADVSEVEYPNLDEPDKNHTPTNKENLNGPGMLFKKSAVPALTNGSIKTPNSLSSRNSKSAPLVDRKSKPSINRDSKSSIGDRKNLNNSSATNQNSKADKSLPAMIQNINNTPRGDSAKKSVSDESQERKSELLRSLSKESSLAKENLDLAEQQLTKEKEFEQLRLRKELEAEESKRMELQKREEQLIELLKRLEVESQEKDRLYAKTKEDNLKMKIMLEEKDRSLKKEEDKELQRLKEREIQEVEKKKRMMQESVERLREQRKKQELAKKKSELSRADVMPRDAVSANSALKRNMSHQDQNNGQNSDYSVPLSRQSSSDSSSRGLVRSHSSPNIAQMVNQEENDQRKTPVVDRTLKPKPTTPKYQTEINSARLRNLNPVYGNCPARPATGLRNLGNTCFMNSIIQCLSNTVPLADYFTSGQYMDDINRDSKFGTGGEVAEEFAVVIKALWMGQYKSFSPKDFKNTVSKCLSVCIGNEQQDSHEFLIVLMEKLHSDLNKRFLKPIPKLENCNDENTFWMHHKNYNNSKMSDVFEGLLKSTLTCMSCRTTSDSFEVFSCLSLPIMTSRCSLAECFQLFLKSEKISGEAAWDCPKCKQKKEAEKRLRICRLPEVLVIQLKRFSYEGLWRRKLQTTVDFDRQLNVPYEKKSDPSCRKYSLYGIVNHFGTLEGGHYTAYCNASSSKWYKYDDHEVSEISSSDIKTSAAYILFYRAAGIHSNL